MQIVSDRDKATRASALGTLEIGYWSEGQAIWSKLGRLSDQQQSLIEERFKYTDKQVSQVGNAPVNAGTMKVQPLEHYQVLLFVMCRQHVMALRLEQQGQSVWRQPKRMQSQV